ncbi:Response regulator receiver domain-containing protein [Dyadobacter soli]|uniref:Response regulator receiver domain-containing protein n=1 Tax=Dyadobacter soli TaxID=659014 RepID=A0A1G7QEC0_9BACT|nr:response regulator [Dyadobacter soli]SDF96279.1 Response regulator receiver domain-containing protein [Dyadobacter soli]
MKGKVLIIEDDPVWIEQLSSHLEFAGFHVTVANSIESAIAKLTSEMFHFITIDMNLNDRADDPDQFEGWKVLETVNRLRIRDITPTMIITGYGADYDNLRPEKKLQSVFFMEKGSYDRDRLINTALREVELINLRFKDDHRNRL